MQFKCKGIMESCSVQFLLGQTCMNAAVQIRPQLSSSQLPTQGCKCGDTKPQSTELQRYHANLHQKRAKWKKQKRGD